MSKKDAREKGRARREAEDIRKDTEKIIKRLKSEGVVKRDKRSYFKATKRNGKFKK